MAPTANWWPSARPITVWARIVVHWGAVGRSAARPEAAISWCRLATDGGEWRPQVSIGGRSAGELACRQKNGGFAALVEWQT